MKVKVLDWTLQCSNCGFEFSVIFNADETEENKKELKRCPCGCEMTVTDTEERELEVNINDSP